VVRHRCSILPHGVDSDNERVRGLVHGTDCWTGVSNAHLSPVRGIQLGVLGDSILEAAITLGPTGVVCVQRFGGRRLVGCDCFPGMLPFCIAFEPA